MNDLWLKKSNQAANTYMDEVSRANQFTSYHNGYIKVPVKILRCIGLSAFEKLILMDLIAYMSEKTHEFIGRRTALAFWHEYPSPYLLEGITLEDLTLFLRKNSNNVCSTKKATLILEGVQTDGNTKRNGQEHRDFLVRGHVNQIRDVHREMSDVENHIRDIMQKLDFKLNTFTGIDDVTASAIVAEVGDITRFTSADKLAKYAGLTPSQMSSGGRGKERNQRQGNRALNKILWGLAVRQVHTARTSSKPLNPLFREYYEKRLSEGKKKKQAIICIMRKLVNIFYSMMKNKTEYRLTALPERAAS